MENKKRGNPIWNVLRTEWKYLGSRKKTFIIFMSFFLIAGLISLTTPLIIGLIFNSIQKNIASSQDLRHLFFLISLLLITRIAFWIFHGPARVLEQLTSFKVHKNYTNSKIKKILELPTKWHKDHHSGDTIDKVNRGRGAIEDFSSFQTMNLSYIVLNIFGSLGILFFVDWKIALFTTIFSSIMLFSIFRVDRKLRKNYKELNTYSNKLSASVFDYLSNIVTVITLRLKKVVSREIENKLEISYKTHRRAAILNESKWAFATISVSLMTVLVLIYKSYTDYTTTGIILIGTLYIFFGYLQKVGNSFFDLGEFYSNVVRVDTRLEGASPIDEAFEEIREKVGGKLPKDWKEIEIKNLDFTYDVGGKKSHIENVNMKIKKGQKIALVGESGSGKSTILALMRGLYSPMKGEIYCNYLPIRKGFEKLKNHVSLIPQDPEIFNNTIRYNITMDLPVSKEDLNKVISMAQLRKVIARLEKGLNTNVLEKGVSLSGGEKQRLALARGLLAAKGSEIILLDEPTSSVDSLNEMKIHESIFKEFKGKTIISSIHKLHLLPKFDYIYLFEKGKIVAEGSLEEIKKNPKFRYIWNKYR